jgi:hypothetical protein
LFVGLFVLLHITKLKQLNQTAEFAELRSARRGRPMGPYDMDSRSTEAAVHFGSIVFSTPTTLFGIVPIMNSFLLFLGQNVVDGPTIRNHGTPNRKLRYSRSFLLLYQPHVSFGHILFRSSLDLSIGFEFSIYF